VVFPIGPSSLCGAILTLIVEVKDVEDYGLWNHLLLSKNTPIMESCHGEKLKVSGEAHLSYSQVKRPLPFKEGDAFQARVTARCDSGFGIDEQVTEYWSSYRVWTCDIENIEILK
jgi:hypothetical protein